MIEIDLPDGSIGEFPDGTHPETIKAALRKRFAPVQHAPGVTGMVGEGPSQDETRINSGQKGDMAPGSRLSTQLGGHVLQGASLNFGDELMAGVTSPFDAAINAFRGKGPTNIGEAYDQGLALERDKLQAAQDAHPIAAPLAEVGGALLTAKVPVGAALKAPSMLGKVARSAGIGGLYGGVSGFGAGEGGFEERAADVPMAAGIGAGFGAASPVVGKGIGTVVNALTKKALENPSIQAIKDISQRGYKQAEQAGLVFSPEAYGKTVDDITAEAGRRGIGQGPFAEITKQENPVVAALLEKMNQAKGAQTGPAFMDAEIMRRVAADSKDPAASMVASKLRGMMDKAAPEDFVAGNVDEGLAGIKQGREMWGRMSRAQEIDDAMSAAKNAVGANYTVAGYQTALKQKFRSIADSEAFKLWPKQDQEAVLSVVRGGMAENLLRHVGRFSPKGAITGGAYGAALWAAPQIAIPMAIATTGARMASSHMGVNAAKIAEAIIKSGKKPELSSVQAKVAQALAHRLMLSETGQIGQRGSSYARGGP